MSEAEETPNNNSPNNSSSSATRARAEARRRRILQKSKDRMSIVSGEVSVDQVDLSIAATATTVTADNTNPPESKIDEDTAAAPDDNGDVGGKEDQTTQTDDKEETSGTTGNDGDDDDNTNMTPTSSKGSSRLAQMRQRRKKLAAAAAAAKSEMDEAATEENNNVNDTNEEEKEPKETNATTTTAKEDTETTASTSTTTEKKKYLGVVKMRRKMLAEKKEKEAQAEADGYNQTTNTSSSSSTQQFHKNMTKKDKKIIPLGPILIQFITVMLIFLVGLDIGIQNHVIVKQTVPNVHSNYVTVDHGIGALKLVGVVKTGSSNTSSSQKMNTYIGEVGEEEEDVVEEEEFGNGSETKPSGVSTSTMKEPNIDPIFGVDFDEMTAGDGLFLSLVRMAVSVHRMLTYLFFTTPLAFISGLLALPKRVLMNPPVMFVCAIVIRYVGKHVLGGSVPELDKILEDEFNDSDALKGKDNVVEGIANTDFVSMGKNYVTNFLKTNFPKASLVYTMLSDARSDMFVVFCGFFLGLVIPSNLLVHEGPFSVSEEL